MDKEISVDKILNKTKRKKVEKFETESMEIFAPINSWHLDNMKNRQLKVTDYSSGVAGQPDRRYVMIYMSLIHISTAAGILAIVFCYTYFYGRLEIAFRKEKEQAVQACKMKQYRTIFANSFEKLYHSGLGKNLENMKDDFNAVTELMTEHRPMFAASLAEAFLFGGYLCWKNPLVGICLILISLLQVIPPLLVKKYLQVNYDNCREIEGKITDYTVSAFQGFMTIKLYQLKDWWLSLIHIWNMI